MVRVYARFRPVAKPMPDFAPSRLIALYSPAPGCGKTTAAGVLRQQGFTPLAFAAPMRAMLHPLLLQLGYSEFEANALLQQRKEELIPSLGVSVRHLLRTLGTEWGRTCVHPALWLHTMELQLQRHRQVVIDDLRYANEAALVQRLGGEIWLLRRPGCEQASSHSSDGDLNGWDGFAETIVNDGDVTSLGLKLRAALKAQEGRCRSLRDTSPQKPG